MPTITFITSDCSNATDVIDFDLIRREVNVVWRSGSLAAYKVRRRDQLRALWCELTGHHFSWGGFANWAKTGSELDGLASLA